LAAVSATPGLLQFRATYLGRVKTNSYRDLEHGTYRTPPRRLSLVARWLPSLRHYAAFLSIIFRSARMAKRGVYGDDRWAETSQGVRRALESAGVKISVTGLDHVAALDGPCVFVGNHMSILESMLLPGFVQPLRPVTFVVKEALIRTPVFKHVMRSRDPIVVTRTDPRADFKTMMQGGQRRLAENRSLIVFPQTTRTRTIDREHFNSIGVKLARRAGVPIVPIAIRSDAWGMAKFFFKDFGRIDPSIPVNLAFGEPVTVTGRGTEAQEHVLDFIEGHLEQWGIPPAQANP
jgi:1-acyl-sn-glycerol-3-phosphate acyltransferase